MGGNPQASRGSLLACPDVLGEIDAIRERGGKVVVIDPRRTGTADRADEWLPIRARHRRRPAPRRRPRPLRRGPGRPRPRSTDVVNGVDELRAAAAAFTPEARRRLVPGARRAHPRAWPASWPPPSGPWSTAASGCATRSSARSPRWLVDVVNILTGHFDAEGGADVRASRSSGRSPDADTARPPEPSSTFGRWHSRVRGAPEVLGQVPLLVPRRGDRHAGRGPDQGPHHHRRQPALSAARLRPPRGGPPPARLHDLVDNYLNETTRFAHVILPGPSPLEQPHFDELIWGLAVRSAAKWCDAVFPPATGRPRVGDPHPARLASAPGSGRRRRRRGARRRLVLVPRRRARVATRRRVLALYDARRTGAHDRPRRSAGARGATATASDPTGSP